MSSSRFLALTGGVLLSLGVLTLALVKLYENTSSATPSAVNSVTMITLVAATVVYVVYTQRLVKAQLRGPHLAAEVSGAQDFAHHLAGMSKVLTDVASDFDAVRDGPTLERFESALAANSRLVEAIEDLTPSAMRAPNSSLRRFHEDVLPSYYAACRQINDVTFAAQWARVEAGVRWVQGLDGDEQKAALTKVSDNFRGVALAVTADEVRTQYLGRMRKAGGPEWDEIQSGKAISDARQETMALVVELRAFIMGMTAP